MLSTPKLNSTQHPSPGTRKWGVPKFIPPPSSFLCQYKYERPRSGLGLIQCLECICETSQRAQTFHHKIQMSDILWDRRQGRTPGARYPEDRRRPALTPGNLSRLDPERSSEHQGCSLLGRYAQWLGPAGSPLLGRRSRT